MKKYAAVVCGRVIEITEREEAPIYPPTAEGYCVAVVEAGEDTEVGMYYSEKGFRREEVRESRLEEVIESLKAQDETLAAILLNTLGVEADV